MVGISDVPFQGFCVLVCLLAFLELLLQLLLQASVILYQIPILFLQLRELFVEPGLCILFPFFCRSDSFQELCTGRFVFLCDFAD